jgi:enoyl-CoA hydratase
VRALETGTEKLLAEVDDGLAVLTFNQPEKHNALSRAMREAMSRAVETLQNDREVRAVVVTGAGDKAFTSGADITELSQEDDSGDASTRHEGIDAWARLHKPILAMIRGYCLGGGVAVALQADIRIASVDSQFGIPAARLGVGYRYANVKRLVSVVGPANASDILFSGRRFGAEEALAMGLINRVVAREDLRSTVMKMARTIIANAPLTVAAAKFAISQTQVGPHPVDSDRMEEMIDACFTSSDFREGRAAFAEKRPPRFTGM